MNRTLIGAVLVSTWVCAAARGDGTVVFSGQKKRNNLVSELLEVARGKSDGRLHVATETTDELVACSSCGVRADKDRDLVAFADHGPHLVQWRHPIAVAARRLRSFSRGLVLAAAVAVLSGVAMLPVVGHRGCPLVLRVWCPPLRRRTSAGWLGDRRRRDTLHPVFIVLHPETRIGAEAGSGVREPPIVEGVEVLSTWRASPAAGLRAERRSRCWRARCRSSLAPFCGMRWSDGGEPAVNGKGDTGDEGGVVGAEERHGGGDLARIRAA